MSVPGLEQLAMMVRDWQAQNPGKDLALGLAPLIGQVYGLGTAAATFADPRATSTDKAMAGAGILPIGKAASAARKIVVGEKGLRKIPKDRIIRKWVGKDGQTRAEIDDTGRWVDLTRLNSPARAGSAQHVIRGSDDLYTAYPGLDKMELHRVPGPGGVYYRAAGNHRIEVGGGAPDREQGNTVFHEIQHALQDLEGRPNGYNGTGIEDGAADTWADRWSKYALDRGEIEARVAAQRRGWSRKEREAVPFEDHALLEESRIRKLKDMGKISSETNKVTEQQLSDPSVTVRIYNAAKAKRGTK